MQQRVLLRVLLAVAVPLASPLHLKAVATPLHRPLRSPAPALSLSPVSIEVVGIGGGGSNAVGRMVDTLGGDGSVGYLVCNTDVQALSESQAPQKLQLGAVCTRGLGAGGAPSVGAEAAVESIEAIREAVSGRDMVFVTAGMGGGTGSGAAPVVARLAREQGALTIGIVSKPFGFEGRRRAQQAEAAIEKLRAECDTLIVVSNNRLLEIVPEGMSMADSFQLADEVLRQGIVGLAELVTKPGLVNVDFADVRTTMESSGFALMGVGRGYGPTRAQDAAAAALSSPLLEFPMARARRVVFSLSGGTDMTLQEVDAVAKTVARVADEDASIIFGATVDDELDGEILVTIVATDFPDDD